MTFSNKLGSSYEQVKEKAKIKTFTVNAGEVKFNLKVRIPLKKEMEEIIDKIQNPSAEKIESVYKRLTAPIISSVEEGGENFIEAINSSKNMISIKDDDIVLDGTSVRAVSTLTAIWESKVEQFFYLLQSETGEPINESYEQICDEFPEVIIKLIVEEIESAVKPNYTNSKKN
jgi:hypothetical protein